MRLVTVRVDATLTIDLDALNDEYGTEYTPREAANDVRESAFNTMTTASYPSDSNDRIIVSATLNNRS